MENPLSAKRSPEGFKPSGAYFWSQYRSGMWKRCRLEYFLHYYAALQGKFPDANDEARELLRRRSLVSESSYFLRLVQSAANLAFNAERPIGDEEGYADFAGQYSRILWRMFKRDRKSILTEEYLEDPEQPFPTTLFFDPERSPEEYFQNQATAVATAANDFYKSPWQELLTSLTTFDLVHTGEVESFPVAECTVYLKISCAFRLQGTLYTVEFCNSSRPSADLATAAALHKLWAFHHYKVPPERTTALFFSPGAGEQTFRYVPDDALQLSAVLDKIKSEVGRFANVNASTSPYSLPRAPEFCNSCRFRGLCSDLF